MSTPTAKGIKLADGSIVKYEYSELANVVTDKQLTEENVAADGKAVGDVINSIKQDLSGVINPYVGTYKQYNGTITSAGKWSIRTDRHYIIIPVKPSTEYSIKGNKASAIAFLVSYTENPTSGTVPSFCSNHAQVYDVASSEYYGSGILPSDCNYLFVLTYNGVNDVTPTKIFIDGYDYAKNIFESVNFLNVITSELESKSNDSVNAVMNIAETYFNEAYNLNNSIIYKSEHGIFSEPFYNDQKAIVCSQFTQACIAGISYENSRFNNGYESYNDPYWWGFVSDGSGHYSWETAEQDKEPGSSDDPDDYGKETHDTSWYIYGRDYMSAQEQYDYFNSKGIVHDFDADHNDIKPGDLLFYLASTWNPSLEDTENDYVSHVVLCIRAYHNDLYSFVHANSNRSRVLDGNPTALVLQEWNYSTTPPSYYVHLADIPIFPSESKSKLIWEKNWNAIGTITGNTKIGTLLTLGTQYTLDNGFYTINTKITGDCDVYVIQQLLNGGQIINHSEVMAGESSIVIYVQGGLSRIDLFVSNGTTYNIENTKIYKGYHSYDD